jgi:hypothetical protein
MIPALDSDGDRAGAGIGDAPNTDSATRRSSGSAPSAS